MKVRQHRGGLAESMATVKEVEPTLEALTAHINVLFSDFGPTVTADQLKFRSQGMDTRIGWDTYLVAIEGYGVFGMTDQLPEGATLDEA
jgi:hypothetical protein